MLELAQQLSYYLSVVDGGASSKLVAFGQQLASVGMIAQSAQASIQSMVAPMQAVAAAWSGREQQLNNIARSLRQYQVVGESIVDINRRIERSMADATPQARAAEQSRVYREQFQQARNFSRGIIQQMAADAAILPGELNDYAQSFAVTYPAAMATATRRVHGQLQSRTIGEILRTSNYLTAGAISAGIDAPQASRDIMRLLYGQAGLDNRTWVELVQNYARGKNGQRLDATAFNRMRGDERFQTLMDVSTRLQPLMDATGDSYDAIIGTFNSLKHELFLSITEPVYNAWRGIISSTSAQMARLAPHLQKLAEVFVQPVARWLDKLAPLITKLGDHMERWLARAPARLHDFISRMEIAFYRTREQLNTMLGGVLGGAQSRHPGRVMSHIFGPTIASMILEVGHRAVSSFAQVVPIIVMRELGVSLGPLGFFVTNLLTRVFMMNRSSVDPQQSVSFLTQMALSLAPLVLMLDAFMNTLALAISSTLPAVLWALSAGAQMVMLVVSPFIAVFTYAAMTLAALIVPTLFFFSVGLRVIVAVIRAFVDLTMASIALMISTLTGVDDPLRTVTMDVTSFANTIRQMTQDANKWWQELGESVLYLKRELHLISAAEYQDAMSGRMRRQAITGALSGLDAANDEIAGRLNRMDPNRRGRPEANRPHVHQDFRYSRFDITQKFAEGFSPERVAAAFTSDLEAMASQRLSSGLAPAFTNG